jgi:hypothetical protein
MRPSATCLDSLFMPALPLLRRLVPTVAGARPVASLSQESSNTSAVQIAARLGTGGVHTAVDVQLRPGNNTGRRNPTNTDHGPSREWKWNDCWNETREKAEVSIHIVFANPARFHGPSKFKQKRDQPGPPPPPLLRVSDGHRTGERRTRPSYAV